MAQAYVSQHTHPPVRVHRLTRLPPHTAFFSGEPGKPGYGTDGRDGERGPPGSHGQQGVPGPPGSAGHNGYCDPSSCNLQAGLQALDSNIKGPGDN